MATSCQVKHHQNRSISEKYTSFSVIFLPQRKEFLGVLQGFKKDYICCYVCIKSDCEELNQLMRYQIVNICFFQHFTFFTNFTILKVSIFNRNACNLIKSIGRVINRYVALQNAMFVLVQWRLTPPIFILKTMTSFNFAAIITGASAGFCHHAALLPKVLLGMEQVKY